MVYVFLLPVVFLLVHGGTGNSNITNQDAAEDSEEVFSSEELPMDDNCTDVRHVKLGIYAVYDKSMVEKRKKRNSTDNITEYLYRLIQRVPLKYFKWIPCTNISLILTGLSALDNSCDVVQFTKSSSLNIDPTLEKFRSYSLQHRQKFGYPDVTVLFTETFIWNKSEACDEIRARDDIPPELRAYCHLTAGAAYYKGICGNNSVAVVSDEGGRYRGATGLAKQIIRLLGTSFDALRTDDCCTDVKYLSSAASDVSWCNDLSPCAKTELLEFIDCVRKSSSACWDDEPTSLIVPTNQHKAIDPGCTKRCTCMLLE